MHDQNNSSQSLGQNRPLEFVRRALGFSWHNSRLLLIKAVIYRIFSVIFTFLLTWLVTESMTISFGVSLFDLIAKTTFYYGFEVGWAKFQRKL